MLCHLEESQQIELSTMNTLQPLDCLEAAHCVPGFKLLHVVTPAVVGFGGTTIIELFLFL